MNSEIVRPATAFSVDTGGRNKRQRIPARRHLEFIRDLPCCVCGHHEVEAAHVRYRDPRYGKRGTGRGEKPDDIYTVPLCALHHREQHSSQEQEWWQGKRIDPVLLAIALWSRTGDLDAAAQILAHIRGSR